MYLDKEYHRLLIKENHEAIYLPDDDEVCYHQIILAITFYARCYKHYHHFWCINITQEFIIKLIMEETAH
ncbi:MAG: elongation factor P hydroxylase [Arsenophonus sp.]